MRAALLALLLLAGCLGQPAGREVGPLVGNTAPDFTVQPVGANATWHLAEHRGRFVVLDLMGVNCEPCRVEMPHLLALSQDRSLGFDMVSVDMASVYPGLGAKDTRDIQQFRAGFNATWDFAPDSGRVGRDYEPIVLPTTVILDREGVIVFRSGGGTVTEQQMRGAMERAGLGGPGV
ncbi:MAG: TlpA family protein disulfide reductase [Halobacteriales archaeon]|nr:TlpA family protein disulfide reductase [Halobacteriales archaeon]